jgi:hypothetical protein
MFALVAFGIASVPSADAVSRYGLLLTMPTGVRA